LGTLTTQILPAQKGGFGLGFPSTVIYRTSSGYPASRDWLYRWAERIRHEWQHCFVALVTEQQTRLEK